jgi:hypothetical protein
MTKFTDHLWSDIMQEHGPAIANASRPGPGRVRRPRAIAGGTLALAVAGTALGLGLTSTGGTAASTTGGTTVVTAAYTITTHSNGSILVKMGDQESVNALNQKLNAMIQEEVVLRFEPGAAPVSGPVTCTPGEPNMKGPQVKILLGTDGTQVIAPGATVSNTGEGTWHIGTCSVIPTADIGKGGTGNTGSGSSIRPGTIIKIGSRTYKVATGTKAP